MDNRRRRFVRVSVNLDAEIHIDDGSDFEVRVVDLSEGGLKISCNKAVAFSILPAEQQTPGPVYDVDLDLLFEFPRDSGHKIGCRCQAVFFNRLAQNEFQFGLQFLQVSAENQRQIRDHVQEQAFSKGR